MTRTIVSIEVASAHVGMGIAVQDGNRKIGSTLKKKWENELCIYKKILRFCCLRSAGGVYCQVVVDRHPEIKQSFSIHLKYALWYRTLPASRFQQSVLTRRGVCLQRSERVAHQKTRYTAR